MDEPRTGWHDYQMLVMETLESHGRRLDGIDTKLTDIRVDIATLKGKAATWGAVTGSIFGALVAVVADVLLRHLMIP